MFKPAQYRAKAGEYGELANTSIGLDQRRAFRDLEQRFAVLADNEQWLADNYQNNTDQERPVGAMLANEEELVLRCLGAALIMQWNTVPAKLQRELFDNAGSIGELLNTSALRGQIARFLHKHKNDENTGPLEASVSLSHRSFAAKPSNMPHPAIKMVTRHSLP